MYQSFDLQKERANNPEYLPQNAFEHQKDAFERLSKLYDFRQPKASILVLPTGAGKTFTSVNWICRNVLPRGMKVLWLAQTAHLLEQAYEEFRKNILELPPHRNTLNIRVVSSSPGHSNASQIDVSDDVLILTVQTAISNYETTALDSRGVRMATQFEGFLDHAAQTGLFLVLDEAHHAPAYGCRNLLIGGTKTARGIRQRVSNANFLGLTATPTYSDASRRGWLWEIFKDGIVYEVDKTRLQKAGILAIPQYHEKKTGETFELGETDYQQIVREHKDLPEWLVGKMAESSARNAFIAQEYVTNQALYGKTIIFADRWYQCVNLKENLLKAGVRADAVYSKVDGTAGTVEERNRNRTTENDLILKKFKNNELDVLVNVKMLTEGTDVPDVDTVFVTRQTTSQILLTQMIGRALRGTKAQKDGRKKDVAHLVFFSDTWRRVLPFATLEGGVEEAEPKVRGRYPMELISIRLVEELSRQLYQGQVVASQPFLSYLPVGWYETEVTTAVDDDMATFREFVLVTEENQPRFESFLRDILRSLPPEWEDERLAEETMRLQGSRWLNEYFADVDDVSNTLDYDLVKLARHVGQAKALPPFVTFELRNAHDLSTMARQAIDRRMGLWEIDEWLSQKFDDSEKLWRVFYKDFRRFSSAFNAECQRELALLKHGVAPKIALETPEADVPDRESDETVKQNVFRRDDYTCQCCGKMIDKSKKRQLRDLHIDHILPYKFGGQSVEDNLQTLCSICNQNKGINEINFRLERTKLTHPKPLDLFDLDEEEPFELTLRRIVNFFFHCKAVLTIRISNDGRSRYAKTWEIELYPGNNPEWLAAHESKLVGFVRERLGYEKLEHFIIR
jgi:superfamily II DNA or RNA helicase/5-methylcytosine-specific restriction endonuclease McrA